MACLTHHCLDCGTYFFDNELARECPDCGSEDVTNSYDESPLYDSTRDMEYDNMLEVWDELEA